MQFHLSRNTRLKIVELFGKAPKEPLEAQPPSAQTVADHANAMAQFWLAVDARMADLTDQQIHEGLGFFNITLDEKGLELRV
jgi:hypothetical protein